MITLYLALVLIGCIVGVLIGLEPVAPLLIESELEARCWSFEVLNDTAADNADDAFKALVDRLMNKTVFVNWSEVLTPCLDTFQKEAIRLLGGERIAAERGIHLDLSDSLSTREIDAPTKWDDDSLVMWARNRAA